MTDDEARVPNLHIIMRLRLLGQMMAHSKHRHGLPICLVTTMHGSETEVYVANKAEPLIGRLR
jgi:hypothetical protein